MKVNQVMKLFHSLSLYDSGSHKKLEKIHREQIDNEAVAFVCNNIDPPETSEKKLHPYPKLLPLILNSQKNICKKN